MHALGALDRAMSSIISETIRTSGIFNSKKDILALGLQYSSEPGAIDTGDAQGDYQSGMTEALFAFNKWIYYAGGATYDIITNASDIAKINFNDYKMIYLPSQKTVSQNSRGFVYTLCDIEAALSKRKDDIQDYVNTYRGGIFSLAESVDK
jgi:hypothetical protein